MNLSLQSHTQSAEIKQLQQELTLHINGLAEPKPLISDPGNQHSTTAQVPLIGNLAFLSTRRLSSELSSGAFASEIIRNVAIHLP
jgi:hypothetical protein